MKSLNEYIEERLVIFPSQVDEKLVINKDYNSPEDNIIDDIINDLFMNPDEEDVEWDGKSDIFYKNNIEDMIDNTFVSYSSRQKHQMKDAISKFKYVPQIFKPNEYIWALRKFFVDDTSLHENKIHKLYEYIRSDENNFTVKDIDLIDDNVFTLATSEKYVIVFTRHSKTKEIFDLFIIEM